MFFHVVGHSADLLGTCGIPTGWPEAKQGRGGPLSPPQEDEKTTSKERDRRKLPYLLQFLKFGILPGSGGQVLPLFSWKQRRA